MGIKKLTDTQIKLIAPLKAAYDKANRELVTALFLANGETFNQYELDLKTGELKILDIDNKQ